MLETNWRIKMFVKSLVLRSSAVALLLLTTALVCVSPAAAKAQSPTRSGGTTEARSSSGALSAKERIEVFEEVWKTINEKYYDPKFNGVDWNAVHERYRPRVDTVKSDEEFYSLLRQMAGELRDAHTRVRSPRQREDRKKQQGVSTGISIREVENTPVVTKVNQDSDAARAGVAPGMIVQTVDGKPIAERIAEVRKEIGSSSSDRATRLFIYGRILAGDPDTALKLGLLRADGKPFEVTLTRRTISGSPQLTSQLLPSGYAYIKFNEFQSPIGNRIKDALETYKNAPGLIVDLRDNGGGDVQEMLRIVGYFFNDKVFIARGATRTGKSISILGGLISIPLEAYAGRRGGQIYSGTVVILTSERTGSAAETFSAGMQENNRATIIGTQSCGCALGVLKHRELKGGGELDISEIGGLTAKGRTLEGNGVLPDKTIALTIADLQQGRDAALKEAESFLKNASKK